MTKQFHTGINATGASVSGSIIATQAWVQSQGYGSSSGGGIPTNIAASTGTIASFTISPSAIQFYDNYVSFYSGIKSFDEISSSNGQGVFLYAGAPDPTDLYGVNTASNLAGTILTSNGFLYSSSAYFDAPLMQNVQIESGSFYGQVNDVYFGLGDPATKDWVTYGATAYNADRLGNVLAVSYAQLASANFTAASVGGSAVATQAYVTSQGYLTSSGSISTASNSASLGGIPAASYAKLYNPNIISSSTNVGFIIRSASSQTANLQEWQDSSGNVRTRVDALGNISASGATPSIAAINNNNNQRLALTSPGSGPVIEYGDTTTPQAFGYSGAKGGALTFQGTARPVRFQNTSTTGVVAQFTAASTQTGDLTQWAYGVDSGSLVLAGVNASGQFYTGSSAGLANTQVYITHSASTITPLVIKGGAYANVKLLDVQNYLGTTQLSVNTAGLMQTGNITVNTITNNNSTAPYLGFGSTNSTTAIMYARAATNVGFIVQGAASATADLQQWQNSSGSTLARISASGTLTVVIDGGSA
jgi:hypothetical protein